MVIVWPVWVTALCLLLCLAITAVSCAIARLLRAKLSERKNKTAPSSKTSARELGRPSGAETQRPVEQLLEIQQQPTTTPQHSPQHTLAVHEAPSPYDAPSAEPPPRELLQYVEPARDDELHATAAPPPPIDYREPSERELLERRDDTLHAMAAPPPPIDHREPREREWLEPPRDGPPPPIDYSEPREREWRVARPEPEPDYEEAPASYYTPATHTPVGRMEKALWRMVEGDEQGPPTLLIERPSAPPPALLPVPTLSYAANNFTPAAVGPRARAPPHRTVPSNAASSWEAQQQVLSSWRAANCGPARSAARTAPPREYAPALRSPSTHPPWARSAAAPREHEVGRAPVNAQVVKPVSPPVLGADGSEYMMVRLEERL